jgi:LPXTG-site transpeptidase (sortase) family protein
VILNNFFKITPEKRHVKIKKTGGVIYSNPRWWKKIIFYFGSVLVIFSLIGILYIYEPIMMSWLKYKLINQNQVIAEIKRIKQQNSLLPTPTIVSVTSSVLEPTPTPSRIVDSDEFNINIPKIGANTKIQANVSPYSKDEYMKVLKNNIVAHSNESSLPGSGKGTAVYLFAHSSQQGVLDARDNSVFYLLGELKEGDDVFINYKGKVFTYRVYMEKIIKSKETDYLTYTDKDKEILVLQTCWPIGTNWQRLLVFAERI